MKTLFRKVEVEVSKRDERLQWWTGTVCAVRRCGEVRERKVYSNFQ
jgi:hypothetical protein